MSTRRVLLVIGLLGIVGGLGYYAYRKGWFVQPRSNPDAIARAQQAPLKVGDPGKEWPQWRGPTRDGRAPAGPFRTDWGKNPPKLLWKADCAGGFSSCSVVGGRLYTQDYSGGKERVLCLNAETGEKLWEHTYPADYKSMQHAGGPRATPTVEGNRVYTVGATGKFLCLEPPAEGKGSPRVVWEHDLIGEFGGKVPQWGVACSPLIEGELVIVQPGGPQGSVAAFDKNSSERKWAAGDNPSGYSSPVAATIHGKRLIFALTGNALLILLPDGTIARSYPMKTDVNGNIATPIVVEDYVFVSAAYQMGSAALQVIVNGDKVDYIEVYGRKREFQNHHASSVFKDRYLFGFHRQDGAQLLCFSLDKGEVKEDWEATGVGKGTLLLADKHIIIQSERGDVHLIEATPEEFRPVAKMSKVLSGNNNWATPTLVDGRLYLRDEQKIVCYDVRP